MRFEYKHFAFLGQESIRAGEAAECAADQEMFWPYHDTLFLNQHGKNLGVWNIPTLVNFAGQLGLDQAEFSDCLETGKNNQKVLDDNAEAGSRGVNSTPTIFINGQMYRGALSAEEILPIIEAELGQP